MRRIKQLATKLLEVVVTAMVAILVLVVLWGVLSRFVISMPSPWTEEVATHLLAWVALLGGAVGFSKKQHLGVDFIHNKLHPDAQRMLTIIVQVLVILFAFCVMVWGGTTLVMKTLAIGQVTPTLNLPMGYVYLSVPVSGLFFILFSVEQAYEICVGASPTTSSTTTLATPVDANSSSD